MTQKKIHVLGGGTVSYVRPHLALTAPAYGETARYIDELCRGRSDHDAEVVLHLTKMASGGKSALETNDHIEALFNQLVEDPATAVIFMNVAMVDYDGTIDGGESGKYGSRLKTREQPNPVIQTSRVRKFLSNVRPKRPDICLVAFKTTCNTTKDDMIARGTFLLNGANCNFVLVNDTGTRLNLIVGPSGVCGQESSDRKAAVAALVDLAIQHYFAPPAPAPSGESASPASESAASTGELAASSGEPAASTTTEGSASKDSATETEAQEAPEEKAHD